MAKITTIIDIGSNSCRMVVFKKTSRFAFNLINETKSKVRISEGCYKNNGNLCEIPMQRTYETLKSFLNISKALKSRKILCVATSALRDAPNAHVFKNRVKKLGINIKIIDGKKEAFYGAVAAKNLLFLDNFITIDIGGGSTELAIVKNNNILDSFSLDLGTVRLKELFDESDIDNIINFIDKELEKLPKIFQNSIAVGIGGTIRSLARVIIKQTKYPFGVIHGFKYRVDKNIDILEKIIISNNKELLNIGIKQDRLDTIKFGTLIFIRILKKLNISEVVTSGVGIREGVYLSDILRNSNLKFPANFDMSVRSLLDRFSIDKNLSNKIAKTSNFFYDLLKEHHNLNNNFKKELLIASKLSTIGNFLNFYKYSYHSFNFILNGLHYGFSHEERILIAYIIKTSKKSLPTKADIKEHKKLLPPLENLQWLSFIISLSINLNIDYNLDKYLKNIELKDNKLIFNNFNFLIKEAISKIETLDNIEIVFKD